MKSCIVLIFFFESFFYLGNNPPANIIRILNSGDGKSIETAYKVNSVTEEYDLLSHLKLKPIKQQSQIKNFEQYDAIITKSKTIYFKVVAKKPIKISPKII